MFRSLFESLTVSSILSPIVLTWCGLVNSTVPDPYLDEVFHVGQALTYWHGQWTTWDPKITTPPVLYLCSWLLNRLAWLFSDNFQPDARVLRLGNVLLLTCIFPWDLLRLLRSIQSGLSGDHARAWRLHTALNICLFPVVFFFSGLYYTDLISVHFVLQTYSNFLSKRTRRKSSIPTISLCMNGLLALGARQTNIFWVAVFLGASELVSCFPRQAVGKGVHVSEVVEAAWNKGAIHDVDLAGSRTGDVFLFTLSIGLATLRDIPRILSRLSPYLFLLAAFGSFVLWNGGVVLGDKENHIASLHLPQMLYFWAYIIFFSWPLSIPYLLGTFIPPNILPPFLRQTSSKARLPDALLAITVLVAMAAAVYFNTVVHPFTLADNRHYVFYIFRILLRKPWIRFAAVPIYFFCACLSIATLAGNLTPPRRPPLPAKSSSPRRKRNPLEPPSSTTTTAKDLTRPTSSSGSAPFRSPRLSLLLIYLLSTALSLITAPLVEPRYFIIPWIIWRLHLPPLPPLDVPAAAAASSSSSPTSTPTTDNSSKRSVLARRLPHTDYRLYVETAWYMLINIGTGYMFLHRGFEWKKDPGSVQRFMW